MFNNEKFLKSGFSLKPNSFFDGYVPLKDVTVCVVVVYNDGHSFENWVQNPWPYMKAMKRNPLVKTCFIREENL